MIRNRIVVLAEHRGSELAERVDGTNEWVLSGTPHTSVYRVSGGVVEVIRVFHGAQITKGQYANIN